MRAFLLLFLLELLLLLVVLPFELLKLLLLPVAKALLALLVRLLLLELLLVALLLLLDSLALLVLSLAKLIELLLLPLIDLGVSVVNGARCRRPVIVIAVAIGRIRVRRRLVVFYLRVAVSVLRGAIDRRIAVLRRLVTRRWRTVGAIGVVLSAGPVHLSVRWLRGAGGRSDADIRMIFRRPDTRDANLRLRYRAPAIGLDLLALNGKRSLWGRRRCIGYDGARLDSGGRPEAGLRSRTDHTALLRREARRSGGNRGNRAGIHFH